MEKLGDCILKKPPHTPVCNKTKGVNTSRRNFAEQNIFAQLFVLNGC